MPTPRRRLKQELILACQAHHRRLVTILAQILYGLNVGIPLTITLTDSVRGAGYILQTHNTNAQIDNTAYFTGFTSDGYSFGTDGGDTDAAGGSYVAWAWDGGDLVTNSAYDQVRRGVAPNFKYRF